MSLIIGCCLFIASIFLPFATDFGYIFICENPGPYTGPQLAVRVAFWSFMHIQEPLARINDTWVVQSVQWLAFSDYWDWWGPGSGTILPSSILIPTFLLQIVVALSFLVTLMKANNAKGTLPILIAVLIQILLYFAGTAVLRSTVSFGFWLSLLSALSIFVAIGLQIQDASQQTANEETVNIIQFREKSDYIMISNT